MKISVALAACRGEPISLNSSRAFYCQLGPGDEVVVSDDDAAGGCLAAARSMGDGRIACRAPAKESSKMSKTPSAPVRAT